MVLSEGTTGKKFKMTPPGIDPRTARLVAQRILHKYIHIFKNISCETKYQNGTFYEASAAPTPEVHTFNFLELMMGRNENFMKIRQYVTLNRQFQAHIVTP
jgi:hypothetical protein